MIGPGVIKDFEKTSKVLYEMMASMGDNSLKEGFRKLDEIIANYHKLYDGTLGEELVSIVTNESKEDFEKRKRKRLMAQYDLIHKCHQVKFQQFKPFRDIIINSGDKDIVEWCYWIFDTRIDEFGTYKDEEKGVFVGGNVCGRSMMKVREEYNEGKLEV